MSFPLFCCGLSAWVFYFEYCVGCTYVDVGGCWDDVSLRKQPLCLW